jgi:hypothetical protein
MIADYAVAGRVNYRCANVCGHRRWDGVDAALKVAVSPFRRVRACKGCGGALAETLRPTTIYHPACRREKKQASQRAWHVARQAATKRLRTATVREKERSLAGLGRTDR